MNSDAISRHETRTTVDKTEEPVLPVIQLKRVVVSARYRQLHVCTPTWYVRGLDCEAIQRSLLNILSTVCRKKPAVGEITWDQVTLTSHRLLNSKISSREQCMSISLTREGLPVLPIL